MRPTHFDIRNPAHAKWMAEAKAGVDRALMSRREAETGRVRRLRCMSGHAAEKYVPPTLAQGFSGASCATAGTPDCCLSALTHTQGSRHVYY